MAISSCSKQQKNTTEKLGESSMVILLPLNFPYENQKCPLMLFPAEQVGRLFSTYHNFTAIRDRDLGRNLHGYPSSAELPV
jgi:hypothetical protein